MLPNATDVSSFQKVRALMATLFHAADLTCGDQQIADAQSRAANSIREADALLAQLGIVDPDTVVQD
jgi:hypothetical protein